MQVRLSSAVTRTQQLKGLDGLLLYHGARWLLLSVSLLLSFFPGLAWSCRRCIECRVSVVHQPRPANISVLGVGFSLLHSAQASGVLQACSLLLPVHLLGKLLLPLPLPRLH